LAAVVVLPAPCKPASKITAGGCVAKSSDAAAPPISAASSRCTIPINACPGVSEPATSSPRAFSRIGGDEVLDYGQRNVGFEQREPHFPQRILDVGIGEARLTAQLFDDAAKPLGQIVEHRVTGEKGDEEVAPDGLRR
jgi:hypothetical protein